MHPYFSEYLASLRTLNDELKSLLQSMPADGLDWAPSAETNSLAVLAAHVAGSQTYWIGDVITRRQSHRNREGEFQTQRLDALALGARLDAALDDAEHVLGGLTLEVLAESRVSPRNGRESTVAWVLFHALEHTALHVGHAQLTRQLWNELSRT